MDSWTDGQLFFGNKLMKTVKSSSCRTFDVHVFDFSFLVQSICFVVFYKQTPAVVVAAAAPKTHFCTFSSGESCLNPESRCDGGETVSMCVCGPSSPASCVQTQNKPDNFWSRVGTARGVRGAFLRLLEELPAEGRGRRQREGSGDRPALQTNCEKQRFRLASGSGRSCSQLVTTGRF